MAQKRWTSRPVYFRIELPVSQSHLLLQNEQLAWYVPDKETPEETRAFLHSLRSNGVEMITTIHPSKQPRRPHYLAEWMERRHITQAELARQTGADRGQISRWLQGAAPGQEWHDRLREFFGAGREGIFRHPDDDWLSRFFENRKQEEIDRIKATLEAAFPRRSSSNQ